jgi:two-component system, sensor histidine kinase RegB
MILTVPSSFLAQPRAGQRELAQMLARLRACAVAAQIATVFVASRVLGIEIAQAAIFAGVAVLAAFATFVWWRLRQPWRVGEAEVVAHFAVDIGVLCYILYLTGGATNPFITLYLVPVGLAATALSPRALAAVVALALSAYVLLMFDYRPLPALHQHDSDAQFNLHVLGMGINFAISAALLGFFIWRLAQTLRERDTQAQRERERALRDEGILAIAIQAAGAAHELNTPLSTLHTLLAELRRSYQGDTQTADDLALLSEQTQRCRDILRELVAVGTAQLNQTPQTVTLDDFVDGCAERFRLLRPEVDLVVRRHSDSNDLVLRITPGGLQNALVSLLNNAADASASRDSALVELAAGRNGNAIEFGVVDQGGGLAESLREGAGLRFFSDKRDGLGLGLALANATAERLGGSIIVDTASDGGSITRLRLPLTSLGNPRDVA